MKRIIVNLFVIVLVLAGSILLMYPYVSFRISERQQSYVVQQYDDSLAQLTAEQLNEEWEQAFAYNNTLSTNTLYDPFASGQLDMEEGYASLLNMDGNGIMCHIKIPKINVDLPVFHGTSAETLNKGVGHLEGSSLPIGGKGTHCVLTGHTGLNTAKLFTDLAELKEGDEFYIYTLDKILAYRVGNILVVQPSEVDGLLPVAGKDYVTLVTCTPYGVNSHRLFVRGERMDYTPEDIQRNIEETEPVTSRESYLLYAGIAVLSVLILTFFAIGYRRRKKVTKNH